LLLGLVLERATGMPVSAYMATRLWRPLGAEADATWNLDSERSGFEKMESGLNATPVDYARFGQLLLHNGEWNGTRVVSKAWVRAATALDTDTDPADFSQYFWWVDVERPGRFYALGNYGQYIYVAPDADADADAVIVRVGRDWGVDNHSWLATFPWHRRPTGPSTMTQPIPGGACSSLSSHARTGCSPSAPASA
jgi:CubicO group peptidase (beta-lactamase class C family)